MSFKKVFLCFVACFVLLGNLFAQLNAPTLVSPKNNVYLSDSTNTLVWDPIPNVISYNVQIAGNSSFSTTIQNQTGILVNQFAITGLSFNQNYYWRVQANTSNGLTPWSTAFSFFLFTPNNLPNLDLWFSSDKDVTVVGSKVSLWKDQGPKGKNASQGNANNRPSFIDSFAVLNYKPVLNFDGATGTVFDYLDFAVDTLNDFTIFIVFKTEPVTLPVHYLISGNGTNVVISGLHVGGTSTFNGYGIFASISGTSLHRRANTIPLTWGYVAFMNDKLYRNGIQPTYAATDVVPSLFLSRIASTSSGNDRPFKGYLAEIIAYKEKLPDSSRTKVENYLRYKYAPKVNLGPDLTLNYGFCDVRLDAKDRFSSYLWSPNSETTASINVSQSGTYSVKATDVFGNISYDTIKVTINRPTINYPADTNFCLGSSLIWNTGFSQGYNVLWQDNDTNKIRNITTPGNYNFTVTDSGSCNKTSNTLTIGADPFAINASLGPDVSICAGNRIGLIIGGASAAQYHWSTGETTSQIAINITGDYILTATNTGGCTATDTIHIMISGNAPVTSFKADTVCEGFPTHFIDSSKVVDGIPITSWLWNFGDSSSDTVKNPVHLYHTAGKYQVILTATTSAGCSKSFTDSVWIRNNPAASFSDNLVCNGYSLAFHNQSTGNITNWDWNFGDSNVSTNPNPVHQFPTTGSYSVSLTVTDNASCRDTFTSIVNVIPAIPIPAPTVLASPLNNAIVTDNSVTFSWSQNPNAFTYIIQVAADNLFTNILANNSTNNTSFTVNGFASGNYFWRVAAISLCLDTTVSNYWGFQIISPANIPNLCFWFEADKGVTTSAGKVSQWVDQGSGGVVASQSNSTFQPQLVNVPLLNNKPAVFFNGSATNDYYLDFPSVNFNDFTVFILYKGEAAAFNPVHYLISGAGGTISVDGLHNGGTAANYNGYGIFSSISGNLLYRRASVIPYSWNTVVFKNDQLFRNGKEANYSSSDVIPNILLSRIGSVVSGTPRPFNGYIAEIIAYKTDLSDTDRIQVETYLKNKYAPPVNLGPDINQTYGFCDVTLDATERFVSYKWSTGASTHSIAVGTSGVYLVTVVNVFGDTTSDVVNVTISKPQINYSFGDTTICLGDTLSWNTGFQGNYSILWNDGTTDTIRKISTTGVYSFRVTDINNCFISSTPITVTIDTFSNLADLGDDLSLCAGNRIGLVSGDPQATNYNWSTGETTPAITVPQSDTFRLTVSDAFGCSISDTIAVNIKGNAPIASFVADTVCLGDSIQFHDFSYVVDSVPISSWFWNFGDASSSSHINPSHLYDNPGIYSVKLIVTTDSACSNDQTTHVLVRQNPTAYYTDTLLCQGYQHTFLDRSDSVLDDSIVSWFWDFGTGFSDTVQNPVYEYPDTGHYASTLAITSMFGCTDTFHNTVNVIPPVPMPDTTILVSPLDSFLATDIIVIFTWAVNPTAFSYVLEVASDSSFNNIIYSSPATHAHVLSVSGFASNATYHWRVRAFNTCGDVTTSLTRRFQILHPTDIQNLCFWFDARNANYDLNKKVGQWTDAGGNHLIASQTVDDNKPTYIDAVNLLNSRPSLYFDGMPAGKGDYLDFPDDSLQNFSIFILYKLEQLSELLHYLISGTTTSFRDGIYAGGTNSSIDGYGIFTNTPSTLHRRSRTEPLTWGLAVFENDSLFRNGVQASYSTIGTPGNGVIPDLILSRIGNATNNVDRPFIGHIAEIVAYKEKLSDTQRHAVEKYFRYKYAPPVNLGPDIKIPYDLCDITISTGEDRFVTYKWSTGDTGAYFITTNRPGTFSVTVTDIFGNTSTDEINIIRPTIDYDDTITICFGQSITLDNTLSQYYQYEWYDGDTTKDHIFSDPGKYWIKLTDTTPNHCTLIDTFVIAIDSFSEQASIGADTQALCGGDQLGLVVGAEKAKTYFWSTGENSPTITIMDSGTYWLTVIDIYNCVARDTVLISIKGYPPIVDFTNSPTCLGDSTVFLDFSRDTSGSNLINWLWEFGDSTMDTIPQPTHLYDSSGNFIVQLTVGNANDCYNSQVSTISVDPLPTPYFTAPVICAESAIRLADASQPANIVKRIWDWDFGVDTTNNRSPLITFPAPGLYPVSLKVFTDKQCTNDPYVDTIEVFPAVHPDFVYDKNCLGQVTRFFDTTPSLSIVQWKWNFPGNITYNTKNPTHPFTNPGTYNVSLTVTNAIACSATVTKEVKLFGEPSADFTTTENCFNFPTQFSNKSVSEDSITKYIWDFGDSSGITTATNPIHVYSDTGIYLVHLQVNTSNICSDDITKPVIIKSPPEAAFTYTPLFGGAPLNVSFMNESKRANEFLWEFGTGDSSVQFEPNYIYLENGTFQITLVSSDSLGCSDTASKEIVIIPPIIDIGVQNLTLNKKEVHGVPIIEMTAELWNFGNVDITSIDLVVNNDRGSIFIEPWNGLLKKGSAIGYILETTFPANDGGDEYACVTAKSPNGQIDQNPSNDKFCTSLNKFLEIIPPYPNPGNGIINLDMFLPKKGNVTISLHSSIGQKMSLMFDGEMERGYNHYEMDVSLVAVGVYVLNIHYQDEDHKIKLVIN